MTAMPYTPALMPLMKKKAKYIIIHDLTCMFQGIKQIKSDSNKSQISDIRKYNWVLNAQRDVNYHFMIEKMKKEYQTVLGRPLNRLCEYSDIPLNINEAAIHVAVVGIFNATKGTNELYNQIVYRTIGPFTYQKIPLGNIRMHHEVTTDKKIICPGTMLKKPDILNKISSMSPRN